MRAAIAAVRVGYKEMIEGRERIITAKTLAA
jgi:hypothetical protein